MLNFKFVSKDDENQSTWFDFEIEDLTACQTKSIARILNSQTFRYHGVQEIPSMDQLVLRSLDIAERDILKTSVYLISCHYLPTLALKLSMRHTSASTVYLVLCNQEI